MHWPPELLLNMTVFILFRKAMKRAIKDANNQSEHSFLHSGALKRLSNFPQGVVNCLRPYYLVTMVNVKDNARAPRPS